MLFNFFRRRKKFQPPPPEAPDYWQRYAHLFTQKTDFGQTIHDTRFVIFDTETTVLDPAKDRILSIGAVSVQHLQINLADTFECFLRQTGTGSADTITIHGILPQDLEGGLSEAEAIHQFIDYIGDAILVGHHIGFDRSIINHATQRLLNDQLRNTTLDTARLDIRFEHLRHTYNVVPAYYTLDALCDRYQIPKSDRHTAAGDAYITAILFLKLISRLHDRGITTLGDLLR